MVSPRHFSFRRLSSMAAVCGTTPIVEAIRAHTGSELNAAPLGMSVIPTGSDLEKGSAATKVINHIKHLQPHDRAQSVRILEGLVGRELPDGLMLTSQQVRKLSTAGMGIGAHTMTHPILKSLDETRGSIRDSNEPAGLESIIGKPVRGFAYPNGKPGVDYTSRDAAIVRQPWLRVRALHRVGCRAPEVRSFPASAVYAVGP